MHRAAWLLLISCLLLPALVSAGVPSMHAGAVLARQRAASCPVPSIAYWKFNEVPTTTTAVDSVGANDGTLTNMTGNEWEAGLLGNALRFDDTDDVVQAGDIAAIDGATELTICASVNHDTITTNDAIFGKGASGTPDGIAFVREDVGTLRTDMYRVTIADSADADQARLESATNSSIASTWTRVCFTYTANDANGLRLYIDGAEDANSPVSTVGIASIDAGTALAKIGNITTTGFEFDGLLDNVKVHEGVWSAAEILADYNGGVGCES